MGFKYPKLYILAHLLSFLCVVFFALKGSKLFVLIIMEKVDIGELGKFDYVFI